MLVNVKNTMSDRAAEERKYGELLHEYREKVVPSVVSGWGDMSGEERIIYVERMNKFFCGMHFLVALAEQADVSMKMYERLIFGEDEVGARSFMAGKSGVNESGAVRLVRTVCKAVQDRGCEKAGKPVQFRGFLKIEHGIEELPLAPFKGNRFNRTCLCTCSRTSDCWIVSPGCQTGAAYSCKGRYRFAKLIVAHGRPIGKTRL